MGDVTWSIKNGDLDEVKKYVVDDWLRIELCLCETNPVSAFMFALWLVLGATVSNVNAILDGGRCALHLAADYGHAAVTEYLIQLGADVNAVDQHGITPLLAAIWENHAAVVRLLLIAEGSAYGEATKRGQAVANQSATSLPRCLQSIQTLIVQGNHRAALDMTGRMLGECAQGLGRQGQPSRHTKHSLQLWTIRSQLNLSVGARDLCRQEIDTFTDLDAPDMRAEYIDVLQHELSAGSLVPFSMRVIWCESVCYGAAAATTNANNNSANIADAIKRFAELLDTLSVALKRAESGYCIDHGTHVYNNEMVNKAIHLCNRRIQMTKQAMANLCIINKLELQDYLTSMQIYHEMDDLSVEQLSIIGRQCLAIGDCQQAGRWFARFNKECDQNENAMKAMACMHKAYVHVFYGQFAEALRGFQTAVQFEPTNIHAINNSAVCELYLGNLTGALHLLNESVATQPKQTFTQPICTNLATLFELATAKSDPLKLNLLGQFCKERGDAANIGVFKLG